MGAIITSHFIFPGSSTVERFAVNEKVLGSNPSRGAKEIRKNGRIVKATGKGLWQEDEP